MKVQNVIKQTLKKQWLLNTLNFVPKNLTAEVIYSSTKFKNKKIPEKKKKEKKHRHLQLAMIIQLKIQE